MKIDKKVLVAISGGVDSSFSLNLLKKEGYDAFALFFRLLGGKREEVAQKRASIVSKKIGTPFFVLDLREEFKERVIDSFLSKLKRGETPNPCVVCNREIKFSFLIEKMSYFSADFVATGHYAKIREGKIYIAEDENKDQTYFLWNLKREWLKNILFPLGEYGKKEEVKDKARELFFEKDIEESQEICFIPEDINSFLRENLGDCSGKIVDTHGKELGEHKGLFCYTIGQRKNIGLSGGPYYVVSKDIAENSLIISKDEEDLFAKELFFAEANLFSDISFPIEIEAKIRYRGERVKGVLSKDKLTFFSPQRAITPGQSVVFYKKSELLGGGIIKR